MMADEYDLIVDALHAVRQVRDVHGSGTVSVGKCDEIAEMLRARSRGLPPMSATQPLVLNHLALAVADAIDRAFGSKRGE